MEHYFSAQPLTSDERFDKEMTVAGFDFQVTLAPGVFSFQSLDQGTRVLLDKVPQLPESGNFLDLGCGWGPICLTMARLRPQAKVWAVDVNERALDLTQINAAKNGLANVVVGLPEDTWQQIPAQSLDVIWSNPPIRIGKEALHEMLEMWLQKLSPSGEAYFVVAKNLGGDTLLKWLEGRGWRAQKWASAKGFRVLRVAGEQAA